MTEDNQHISALMDDEYDSHSLKELLNDKELKATWARYHLIGDCIRDTLPAQIDMGLSSKIHDSIQSEPTVLAPERKQTFSRKPVVGFAIAASVALVAVLGIKQNSNTVNSDLAAPVIASNQLAQPVSNETVNNQDVFTFAEPQIRPASVKSDTPASLAHQRMSGYLVNHNQYRSSNGMNGIMPYVRIVTIESQE